jgi:hypothetical protein
MPKAFTLDSQGISLAPPTFGAAAATITVMGYLDAVEDTLTFGSAYPFRTAAGVSLTIPDNAVVTNVRFDCVTAFVGVGCTMSFGIEAADDVKLVTAITAAPLDGTISLESIMIKTTAAQTLDAAVAVATPSAGRLIALIDYFVTE